MSSPPGVNPPGVNPPGVNPPGVNPLGVNPPSVTRRLAWLTLITFNFGVFFISRNMMGYAVPFAAHALQLSNLHIGWLAAAVAGAWALGSFTGGIAARHWPLRALLAFCTLLSGLLTIAVGWAGSFALLFVLRAALGFIGGPALPLSQTMVAGFAPPAQRGMYMGAIQAFGSALTASLLAPILLVPLMARHGWPAGFAAAGLLGVLMTPLLLLLPPPTIRPAKIGAPTKLTPSRNLLLSCICSAAIVGLVVTNAAFVPLFLVQAKHIAPAALGPLVGAYGLGGMIAAFAGPTISDRWGRRPVIATIALAGAAGLITLWLPDIPQGAALAGTLVIAGMTGGSLPLVMAIVPAESVPAPDRAAAVGLVQGVAEVAGGVLTPLAAGALAQYCGIGAILWVSTTLALTAASLQCLTRETAPCRVRNLGGGSKG